jgi:hypothetical protein
MIKIPFDRCVIVSTLDFAQITERLESAIYDPSFQSSSNTEGNSTHQRYLGQIQGFKFLANRIVGYKYLHLPIFLSPTIEGKIASLHHGYEISLAIKLNNITVVLLLTWLGGLFTVLSSILDNILIGSSNDRYLITVGITAIVYILVIAYFYFDAWRATKFFRTLFVKRFAVARGDEVVDSRSEYLSQPSWHCGFDFPEASNSRSSIELLRQNLPSFPTRSSDPSHSD